MKVSLISYNNAVLLGRQERQISAEIMRLLYESAVEVKSNIVLSDGEELDSYIQLLGASGTDYIIILGSSQDTKESLELKENEFIKTIDQLKIALLPQGNQGLDMFKSMLLPGIVGKTRTKYYKHTIKTFGLSESQVSELIDEVPSHRSRVVINLYPSIMECDVVIRYSSNMNKPDIDVIIDAITSRLGASVYASSNTTLAKRAFELLILRDKKIAIAESFTGGSVTAGIVTQSKASKTLIEGIISYSNISKIHRLDVNDRLLISEGAVSSETAYQMAAGILNTSGADIVIATTGYAGPEDQENTGLAYIAIGNEKGIHLFKYHFNGSREEIIESGVKAAYFRLIQLLKKSESN